MLRTIKTYRNKVAHSEPINARQTYEAIEITQKLFEAFKPGKKYAISKQKDQYVDHINKQRLIALENLV